jgi:hypothetical protein
MKKKLLCAVISGLSLTSQAFASGSTDYICAAAENIRYEYSDSDSAYAKLFRATGINTKALYESIIAENSATLDAFQVSAALKRSDEESFTACIAWDDSEEELANQKKCFAKKKGAIVKNEWTTVKKNGNEHERIVQTVERNDGVKITLDIRNHDKYEEMYFGKLTIEGDLEAYKNLKPMNVTCQIGQP